MKSRAIYIPIDASRARLDPSTKSGLHKSATCHCQRQVVGDSSQLTSALLVQLSKSRPSRRLAARKRQLRL